MPDLSIGEGRRLLAEASDGPWMGGCYYTENGDEFEVLVDPGDFRVGVGMTEADAALIVFLRNHADALLEAAEQNLTPAEAFYAQGAMEMVGPDGTKDGLALWESALAKLSARAGNVR